MKKLVFWVVAIVLVFAFTTTALAQTQSWTSEQLYNQFTTTYYLSKLSSQTWGSYTTVVFSRLVTIGGDITDAVDVTPVNQYNQVLGNTLTFSYENSPKYSYMTNTSSNRIYLLLQNNGVADNILTTGTWSNTAS